ncbi:MAG TPA: hypothetical protein VIY27_03575 [Myxococcota bacterium]
MRQPKAQHTHPHISKSNAGSNKRKKVIGSEPAGSRRTSARGRDVH